MFFCCFFATVSASLNLYDVSFYFLLTFCNMDPSVFATAGTIASPSSPNINAVMLSSTTTSVVIPLSNTQQVINLKLTDFNYLFWRMQMKLYLISQGVFLFVDGSHSCPSPLDLSSHSSAAFVNISHMETIRSTHTRCFTLIPLH